MPTNEEAPAAGGDGTRRGNQAGANNPPVAGPSQDQDKYGEQAAPGGPQHGRAGSGNPAGNVPKAAGGPAGSEANRGPVRTKPVDGFSPADSKRGWTDNSGRANDDPNPETGKAED